MSERLINEVDLICIDTRQDISGSIKAIETCLEHFAFKTVKLITNRDIGYKYQHLIPYDTIRSISDYSKFCVYDLWKYIEGTHCLIVQYDGYILNPNTWTDEWLNLDYIGANNGAGGNGGFSLRSKKFCKYVSDFYIAEGKNRFHPEDNAYASWNHEKFKDSGFVYGDTNQMHLFSKEHGIWTKQFGFHDNSTALKYENKTLKILEYINCIDEFEFGRVDSDTLNKFWTFKLNTDGFIEGEHHDNETFWKINDKGHLIFLDKNNKITTYFNEMKNGMIIGDWLNGGKHYLKVKNDN